MYNRLKSRKGGRALSHLWRGPQPLTIEPYSLWHCRRFLSLYQSDPAAGGESFCFSEQAADRRFSRLEGDRTRRVFAICLRGQTVGELQLRELDLGAGCATLSAAIAREELRGRGIGAAAVELLLERAFLGMGLRAVFADALEGNLRSLAMLRKVGFEEMSRHDGSVYLRLSRQDYLLRLRDGSKNPPPAGDGWERARDSVDASAEAAIKR